MVGTRFLPIVAYVFVHHFDKQPKRRGAQRPKPRYVLPGKTGGRGDIEAAKQDIYAEIEHGFRGGAIAADVPFGKMERSVPSHQKNFLDLSKTVGALFRRFCKIGKGSEGDDGYFLRI